MTSIFALPSQGTRATVRIAGERREEPEPPSSNPEPQAPLPEELPAAGPKIPLIDEAAANIDKAAAALAKFGKSAAGIFGGNKQSVQAGLCGIDVGNRVAFMAYLGQAAAVPGSKAQREVAGLVDEVFYSLSADDQRALEEALGKSWAEMTDQEKVQNASLGGPLFEVLQRVIQEKAPKGLAC